jgi:uncharacterized RDD family membrane protein YckC
MSKPVECPYCGFINLQEGRECARCRKPLPGRENQVPEDEHTDSQTDLTGSDTLETVPPPLKTPEEKAEEKFPPGAEAETTAEKPVIPEAPPAKLPEIPEAKKPEPEMDISDSGDKPLLDEESLTYTGSDAELRELSRFFKEVKRGQERSSQQVMPEPETEPDESISRVEIAPPTDLSEPGSGEESSDSFKPDFSKPLLPGFGEQSVSYGSILRSSSTATAKDESAGSEATDAEIAGKKAQPRKDSIPAPLSFRALAGAADLLVYTLIFSILYLGAIWAGRLDQVQLSPLQWLVKVIIPLGMMMTVIFLFSETFFALTSGQTPGQMIFKLKTAEENDEPLRFAQALIRALIYLVLLLPLGLGMVTIILGRDHRGAHEQFSRTKTTKIP